MSGRRYAWKATAYFLVLAQGAGLSWGLPGRDVVEPGAYAVRAPLLFEAVVPEAAVAAAEEIVVVENDETPRKKEPVAINNKEEEEEEGASGGAGKASAYILAASGGKVELGGASVEIPAGALEEDKEITIERLVGVETGGLENQTSGGGAYRFLPAGERFREEVVIRLPYGEALDGRPGVREELLSYYYDEAAGKWEALEKLYVDEGARVVVSVTGHFTDMINGTLSLPEGPEPLQFNINSIKGLEGADPSAGVGVIEGLEGDYTGGAHFRIGLAVPGGRAGMAPRVSVGYSSDGGNGALGKGWSLEAGGEVTYDTRRGLPEYDFSVVRQSRFMLDGVSLEYVRQVGNYYEYQGQKESGFERVRRYREPDYWEVTDKKGVVRVYGKGDGGGGYGASWAGAGSGKKYRWFLESETDSFGNRVRYEYEGESGEVYLKDIWYTERGAGRDGAYRVRFEYSNGRSDVVVSGRGKYVAETKKRLERVEMRYGEEVIRSYRVTYLNDENPALAAELFGVTRVVKFGEEKRDERGEYQWAYEFEYEGFQKRDGEAVMFGEIERWDFRGALQEQRGENGGGGGTVSGGAGIGAPNADARVSRSSHFGSSNGYMETVRTLIDINGDGKPDMVEMDGNALRVYLNTGEGFESREERWVFEGGGGIPGEAGRESQHSNTYGWSIFAGAGLPGMAPGATSGETKQESWSTEETGFADINGDGLPDIVIKGSDYYWQNTGRGFRKTSYAGSIPGDVERILGDSEVKEYDEAYYQEAPLRSWRIPYGGSVEVSQRVTPATGKKYTEDGVAVYTYTGGGEEGARYEVREGKREDGGGETFDMESGEALYFVSDAGWDIRSNEEASDDINWNIKIRYEAIRYFERLNRDNAFFVKGQIDSSIYQEMSPAMRERYIEGGGFIYGTKAESQAERDWAARGWLDERDLGWAAKEGLVIPGVLEKGAFDLLWKASEGLAYESNEWSPDKYTFLNEELPTPREALFNYYRYDAGLELYTVKKDHKDDLDLDLVNQYWEHKTYFNQFGSDNEWEQFLLKLKNRKWNHLESQILSVIQRLTEDERLELVEIRLSGRDDPFIPRWDTETGAWFYGEEGTDSSGTAGWYRDGGTVFRVDAYEGKDILLDLSSGLVSRDGETIGTGWEEDGKLLVTIKTERYRQEYRFEERTPGREVLSEEEAEELRAMIRGRLWANEAAWQTLEGSRYDELFEYAGEVGGAYELIGETYVLKADLDPEETQALNALLAGFVEAAFFSCYRRQRKRVRCMS